MNKTLGLIFGLVWIITQTVQSQVYLSEGFEGGARPDGWLEEMVSGNEPWRYRNGGHSPNDNNWLVPPEQYDMTRNPPSAYAGSYNTIFFKQGDNNERTKLVTPAMDLLGGSSIELSFYLCQIPWTFEGSTGWDVLRVYYKVSEAANWVLLHEFLDPVYEWEKQTLVLPNLSTEYYVAFEGQTRWGYGTCIDNIVIEETVSQPFYLGQVDVLQPFTRFVPSGSKNIPILRVDLRIFGNTGSAFLDYINFRSLNTSDTDIDASGVKLFYTTSQTFSASTQVGNATNFVSGVASFTGLNQNLPPGISYLWLTYDVSASAIHGNILDVMIEANELQVNGSNFPAGDQSPDGDRIIYETRYYQDFEGTHNWDLTGEFEVAVPNGMGGSPGNPNPSVAYSGTKILGTDISGLGANPYHYEPGLSESSSFLATSPNVNMFYYTNLHLFFQRHLNIEVWDNAAIQVSIDNGATWQDIWLSNTYLSDFNWQQEIIPVPNAYARSENFRIRYKLGPTDAQNNYTGWNIDDVYLTGEFISRDAGISEWIYPQSGSGHSANDSVTVRILNYGGAAITDPVPVAYSFNGGATWTTDFMTQSIPVGGSVVFTFPTKTDLSAPGLRSSVLAKTILPGDQFSGNDQISTQVYIVPTYEVPYAENFEAHEGFWTSEGTPVWDHGTPAGSTISSAYSGTKSWATGLAQSYGDIIASKNQIIFEDDFEADNGWSFSGEFLRGTPSNQHLPYYAYSGYECIGTDLTGTGSHPFAYENGISSVPYSATSPIFNVNSYSNINVSYADLLAIQAGDSVKFEVSPDNGSHWYTLWKNTQGEIMDTMQFEFKQFQIHDSLSNASALRFRFSLFYSSASGLTAAGWFIDDFFLTGDLISDAPAYLTSPNYDLSGLTHPVWEAKLWKVTEQDTDGATMQYSLDDGLSWIALANASGFDSYWNWYTGNYVSALESNGWSGQSSDWMNIRHLLPPALVGKEDVRFRLKFHADKFNNDYDGIALDDVKIYEAPHDVGITEIIYPVTTCELSPTETFALRIRNFGIRSLQAGDSIRVGYYIDRSGEIQAAEETIVLEQSIAIGASKDFNMSQTFDFSTSGEYHTTVYTIEDDPFFYSPASNDSIFRIIRVNKPVVDLGPDISTVRPDTIILIADEGIPGHSYLWQDGSPSNQFSVNTEGIYYVRVTNDLGCSTSDTIEVMQLIPDIGVSSLITPSSACELGSNVTVHITIQNFGTDTLELNDTIFVHALVNQADHKKDTLYITQRFYPGESMEYTFSQGFDFTIPGTYAMKLFAILTDDFNTSNDTLLYNLEVYGYPVIDLGPDTVVQAPQYLLEPGAGYYEYLWQDASTDETYLINEPGFGTYKVIVKDEHGCSSVDSVYVALNVIDLTLYRILSPETACGLTENITVSARLRNTGNQAIPSGETINMSYSVDAGATVQDVILLSEDLQPGDSIDFVFSQFAVVQTGQWYDFSVSMDYINDMVISNDAETIPVGIFESPVVDLGEGYQVITAREYILDAGPGFISYFWQDGSTNQTFLVDQPGIGTYSVTVTDGNGCSTTEEVQIMLAVPDIGISAINHPITTCDPGLWQHVEVVVKNYGNWDIEASASIGISYSLNGGAIVTENLVLNVPFEKASEITYTFLKTEDFSTPGNFEVMAFTSYNSDLIPVNDTLKVSADISTRPVVDIGNGQDTILTYDPVTLSATPGYLSYEWQDGSAGVDFVVTEPGGRVYSVTVTGEGGCTTYDEVYVMYESPDIEVTRIVGPVNACKFNKNTLVSFEIRNNGYYQISTSEALGLFYSVNGGPEITESRNLSTPLQPGEIRILTLNTPYDFSITGDYQLSAGVNYAPDLYVANNSLSSQVSNWGFPAIDLGGGNDTIHSTLPVILDAGAGYNSYLWQNNSTGQTIEASAYGLYWVVVTSEHGCASADSVVVTYPLSNGQLWAGEERIRIFPNPAQDFLWVEMDMEEENEVVVQLYTLQNQLVFHRDMQRTRWIRTEINVDSFTPGFYYLKLLVNRIPYTFVVVVL